MITIKEARLQAGLTQRQFAERYDIPIRSLEDWESNRRKPPVYVVNLILRCLEIDFGIDLKEQSASDAQSFILTYSDGTPLSTRDEMFVRTEKEAKKKIELIKVEDGGVKTYKCSNGFIFKAKINK